MTAYYRRTCSKLISAVWPIVMEPKILHGIHVFLCKLLILCKLCTKTSQLHPYIVRYMHLLLLEKNIVKHSDKIYISFNFIENLFSNCKFISCIKLITWSSWGFSWDIMFNKGCISVDIRPFTRFFVFSLNLPVLW